MNTQQVRSIRLLVASVALTTLATSGTAQVVDPDPELFDGSKGNKKEAIEQQQQQIVDDWEKGNLILYDSNEEGSEQGGQGVVGGEGPGMEVSGGAGLGGLSIPGMGGGGIPEGEENEGMPGGMPPQGLPEGEVAAAAQKPGDVAIGDPSQSIASAAQPLPLGDTEGLADAEDDGPKDGGDNTRMKAASGQQSGRRGAGIEQGDAIPSDL